MWLPTKLYESLPTVYIVVGLTFLAGSLYIGLHHKLGPFYFGFGVVSILSGLFLAQKRLHERRRRQESRNKAD